MISPAATEQLFDRALRIQLGEKKMLALNFSSGQIGILLPSKRALALSGALPMSKITALLAEMEQDQLIRAEQRGGMWTAPAGNRIIAGLLAGKYRKDAAGILGPEVLETLLLHLRHGD